MLRKTALLFLLFSLIFLTNCQEETLVRTVEEAPLSVKDWPESPISKSDIFVFAERQLKRSNRFEWSSADDFMIYSAAVRTDSVIAIGYQPVGFKNLDQRLHEINIQSQEWLQVKNNLISFIVEETNKRFPQERVTAQDLMPFEDDLYLPAIDIKIYNPDIIAALREMPEVRYVEPLGFGSESTGLRSDAGCGISANSVIPGPDYTITSPQAKVSWHLNEANVPAAWNTSSGAGITISILDTGTSPNQSKLNGNFNEGLSQGRTHTRRGYYKTGALWWARIDGPNDRCGHGTQMAGLAAGPRGFNNSVVGAAYNANLVSLRVTGDVVINGSNEKRGVADGLTYSANRSDVRIISMSIGDVFSSSRVADAVRYAYGRGKLIFAAAGTSLSWTSWWGVIFPASMNETVAVTGVKDGLPLQKCNTCHDGSAVDFVAVMQRRNDNDRTALTLFLNGNTPANVGGSSAATATTSGIAALVWATNPSMSRSQVLQRLKNASQFYPSRDGNFGYGKIDAAAAVAGTTAN
ncbi:MAG: S8/S53 family peptidase [Bacteroidota bacterium]